MARLFQFLVAKSVFLLPNLAVLSPDKSIRLHFLDKAVSDFNLPNNVSESWRDILSERALEDDEVDAFHSGFLDTPVAKARSINRDVEDWTSEQILASSSFT